MITQIIYQRYLKHIYDKYVATRRQDVYYVHEFTLCYMKAQILRQLNQIRMISEELLKDTVVIGEIIHEALLRLIDNEPKEVCKQIEDIEICGTADALIDDTVIEIKYVSSMKRILQKTQQNQVKLKPLEHHVLQARMYGWLYDARNVILLYVTPRKLIEVRLTPMDENEVRQHVLNWINLKPTPMWDWECKLCTLKKLCPLK